MAKPLKVLIISRECWREDSNEGNVLTSLFAGQPFETANVYCKPGQPDNPVCTRYFQLTDRMALDNVLHKTPVGRALTVPGAQAGMRDAARPERPDGAADAAAGAESAAAENAAAGNTGTGNAEKRQAVPAVAAAASRNDAQAACARRAPAGENAVADGNASGSVPAAPEAENKSFYDFFRRHNLEIFYTAREALWGLADWKSGGLGAFVDAFAPDVIFAPLCYSRFVLAVQRFVIARAKAPAVTYIYDDIYSLRQLRFSPVFWANRFALRRAIRRTMRCYRWAYTMTPEQAEEYARLLGCEMRVLRKAAPDGACAAEAEKTAAAGGRNAIAPDTASAAASPASALNAAAGGLPDADGLPGAAAAHSTAAETAAAGDAAAVPACRKTGVPVRFLYAGGVYYGRDASLARVADALRALCAEGVPCRLDVYTSSPLSAKARRALDDGCTSFVHPPVPYAALQRLYADSDVALHVESFRKKYALLTRLSFSTKIVDCLASGCAVLAICPQQNAGWRYLRREDAAVCVCRAADIAPAVRALACSPETVRAAARRAAACCARNHAPAQVRAGLCRELETLAAQDRQQKQNSRAAAPAPDAARLPAQRAPKEAGR